MSMKKRETPRTKRKRSWEEDNVREKNFQDLQSNMKKFLYFSDLPIICILSYIEHIKVGEKQT